VDGGFAYLDAEESAHCVRVLRHRVGDEISVIDGSGSLMHCVLSDDSPKEAAARVVSEEAGWGAHPYYLRMAVCPTKNIDRYEWFVEKAVELGVDEIVPVIGEHSERRTLRLDRLQRIAVSAAKQSLKGAVPAIAEPLSVAEFVRGEAGGLTCSAENAPQAGHLTLPDGSGEIRLIAYCSDDVAPRGSIVDALAEALPSAAEKRLVRAPEKGARYQHSPAVETPAHASAGASRVTVLIGPEGDFSQEEVRAALDAGFIPVHLGPSRLRTETAALTAVQAVYLTLGPHTGAYDSASVSGSHLADCKSLAENKS
jgi:16S rRNA (uracil1498-N3)-methyltransferase